MTDAEIGAEALAHDFEIGTIYIGLYDVTMSSSGTYRMTKELEDVEGIQGILSVDSVLGPTIPLEFLGGTDQAQESKSDAASLLVSDHYKLMLLASEYESGSREVNAQMDEVLSIMRQYDAAALLTGQAPIERVKRERLYSRLAVGGGVLAAILVAVACASAVKKRRERQMSLMRGNEQKV